MILLYGTIFTMGWIVAAILFGLWWGERGRRMDVQWATGLLRSNQQEAKVVNPAPDPEQLTHQLINEQAREDLIHNLMDEGGVSRRVAEEEAEKIIANLFRVGTFDIP